MGEALKRKSGACVAVTESTTVAVCVMPPPVAVTVTLKVPVVAVLEAERLSVELPLPGAAIVPALKLAVMPAGRPLAESVMAELNPPVAAVEMVVLATPPWAIDRLEGEALNVKPGVAAEFTVRVTVLV